jgi:hypothetical protein
MKPNFSHALALCTILASNCALAGPVTIPKTFTAGTPARAADVNADFSAVATAANGSAQDITTLQSSVTTIQSTPAGAVVISVGGTKIGSLFAMDGSYTGTCSLGPVTLAVALTTAGGCDQVIAIDKQLFLVAISVGNGAAQISTLPEQVEGSLLTAVFYYDQPNCAGNLYLAFVAQWLARQGYVAAAADPTDPNQSYYAQGSPSTATIMSRQLPVVMSNGTLGSPTCSNVSAPFTDDLARTFSFYLAAPNNPAVTGIPKTLSGNVAVSIH